MTVIERDFITKHHPYLSNNICYLFLKVLSHIDSILQSPRAPPLIFRPSKGPVQNDNKENGQGCGFEHLPLTVEMWADQLIALKVTTRCCTLLFGFLSSVLLSSIPPSVSLWGFLYVAFVIFWPGVKFYKWSAVHVKYIPEILLCINLLFHFIDWVPEKKLGFRVWTSHIDDGAFSSFLLSDQWLFDPNTSEIVLFKAKLFVTNTSYFTETVIHSKYNIFYSVLFKSKNSWKSKPKPLQRWNVFCIWETEKHLFLY